MNNPPTANPRWREKPCTNCAAVDWMYGRKHLCTACRKLQRETSAEAVMKTAAQRAARDAIRRGVLIRGKCVACEKRGFEQNGKSHGHHEDYTKPLDVVWLCPLHHKFVHSTSLAAVLGRGRAA